MNKFRILLTALFSAILLISCETGGELDPNRQVPSMVLSMETGYVTTIKEYSSNGEVHTTTTVSAASDLVSVKNGYISHSQLETMIFTQWFPLVIAKIDSVECLDKDGVRVKIWRQRDSFDDDEQHFFNVKSWGHLIDGSNAWFFTVKDK